MNENKQLVVINSYLNKINFNMPKKAEELNKITVKKINNALCSGFVDTRGIVWFDCNKLHTILRVKTKKDATFLLETIDDKYKVNYNNVTYVIWSKLVSIIADRIEHNPKNQYLQLVFNMLDEINNSNDVKILQFKAKEVQSKNIKKLKKTRIKQFKIIRDELTNEKLNKTTAEFSHIRSVNMFPLLSEFVWNGLIVNKKTHSIITAESINNEDELYSLCYNKGWNIKWYNEYKQNLKLY